MGASAYALCVCTVRVQVFAYVHILGEDWSFAFCSENNDCDQGQYCGFFIPGIGVCTTIRESHVAPAAGEALSSQQLVTN